MQRTLPNPSVEIEARAWRLRFLDAPPDLNTDLGAADVIEVNEPRKVYAVAETVDPAAPPSRFDDVGGRSLALLWMPPLAFDGADSAWLEGIPLEGLKDGGRVVRAGLRTSRVVWTNARAVIYAPPDQFADARDALVRFTVLERDVCEIEAAMPDIWAEIRRTVKLSHTVTRGDVRRNSATVGAMTERVTELNRRALLDDTALEQMAPALSPASKRLFAELALQANLFDRLEALGEPLDFAFDYHEVVNNRLTEASQFFRSYRVDSWILAVLALELIATSYPYIERLFALN